MKLLLTTLHAKYSHASLALPCLAACCAAVPDLEIVIREWTVHEPRELLLRQIIAQGADVIAFSCYIWNIEPILKLAADIRKVAPDTVIVLGGPEASFGVFELMQTHPAVDFVVKGEGEAVFLRLMAALATTLPKGIPCSDSAPLFAEIPNLFFRDGEDILSGPRDRSYLEPDSIPSPFPSGLADLSRPLIYYETSRGCPFSCAFCLSSLEGQVRSFSLPRIESDLAFLMEHGVSQIKLVDRTFNYDARRANQIWEFILQHNRVSHFHFEIAADLLTDENLRLLQSVPADTFRFEIGVQSTSADTLEQVQRRADWQRISSNVLRLAAETRVELHLDLVAGLPGEDYAGLLDSLQQVADLAPQVIQIEPLKVLKGSPMREIAAREQYRFSDFPPYTILSTPWLSFQEIGRIEIIGRLLDLFHNQSGFAASLAFMGRSMNLALLLDRMAARCRPEELNGRSTRRLYELFAHLAGPLLPREERTLLHDALFFDYCLREMPLMGKLPTFAKQHQHQCSWPGRSALPEGLELPTDSRIKIFRCRFLRDHRNTAADYTPTTISFVYASGAGRGLQVLLV